MFNKLKMVLTAIALSMFAMSANAALVAADVAALGTEVTADVGVVKAAVLPLVFLVLALVIGIKLLKRLANKI